ncbi:MAG: hypothetical protein KF854_07230 [Nitrospira sp.]|nr:hypothetical protein [Nitrospira sp.]MBX7040948.1 hypothetical protein [Nitrospira sp.]MCW5795741.1 hypothetical protein [Nitrospira sp.]HMU32074.1 hypothetical protein [Nitrospira sp.]HNA48037.1 hypothetical protein [Nitrospira sp.]
MRLYIACGLTHVPRHKFSSYTEFIHQLAQALQASGAEVRYALKDSDPQLAQRPLSDRARLCYAWDREMVEWADAVIGEATYASTGLGIELQIATQKATPIILCFQRKEENRVAEAEYLNPDNTHHHLQIGEGYVTLMALGLPTIFKVVGYATEDEAVQSILHATTLITIQQYNRTQSSQSTGDLGRV